MNILFAINATIYFSCAGLIAIAAWKLPNPYRWSGVVSSVLCLYYGIVYAMGVAGGITEIAPYTRTISGLLPVQLVSATWFLVIAVRGSR